MRAITLIAIATTLGCAIDRQTYVDDTSASYGRTLASLGLRIDKDQAAAALVWQPSIDPETGERLGGGSATIGRTQEGFDGQTAFMAGLQIGQSIANQALAVLGPSIGRRIEGATPGASPRLETPAGEILDCETLEERIRTEARARLVRAGQFTQDAIDAFIAATFPPGFLC